MKFQMINSQLFVTILIYALLKEICLTKIAVVGKLYVLSALEPSRSSPGGNAFYRPSPPGSSPRDRFSPPDSGPRASADTTTAVDAGFTRAAIEQELLRVMRHRQSLSPGGGPTSSPNSRIVRSQNRDVPLHSIQRRVEARKLLKATGQHKVFTEKLLPSIPPVGPKSSPAAEGGAEFEVNRPPVLAVDSNPTDPLLACTRDETMVAPKI